MRPTFKLDQGNRIGKKGGGKIESVFPPFQTFILGQ